MLHWSACAFPPLETARADHVFLRKEFIAELLAMICGRLSFQGIPLGVREEDANQRRPFVDFKTGHQHRARRSVSIRFRSGFARLVWVFSPRGASRTKRVRNAGILRTHQRRTSPRVSSLPHVFLHGAVIACRYTGRCDLPPRAQSRAHW